MTDQTPATEAGRRLADDLARYEVAPEYAATVIIAIEAEARRTALFRDDYAKWMYEQGRADALREAAERVRALMTPFTDPYCCIPNLEAVLAILDPEAS